MLAIEAALLTIKEPTNKTKRSMAIINSSGKIKSVPTDNPELN